MHEGWLDKIFFDNTVRAYAIAALTLVGLVLIFMLAKRLCVLYLGRRASESAEHFDRFLAGQVAKIGTPVFVVAALYFSTLPLELNARLRLFLHYALVVSLTLQIVFTAQDFVRYGVGVFWRRARPDDPSPELVTTNVANVLRWAIWSLAVVFILDNLGVNISTLLAGLGIGGVAVAFASQAILGDLFSSLSIFVDKPFEVGDFIVVDNFMGTVEYIGLKTTRLRSLDGEQLVLANSDLTKSRIRNYKRMKIRRVAFKVSVVYETPTEKLRKIPELVKNVFGSFKDVKLDRVNFASLGDFSLVYEIVYYVHSADFNLYMDRQEAINLALKNVLERESIELAHYQPLGYQRVP